MKNDAGKATGLNEAGVPYESLAYTENMAGGEAYFEALDWALSCKSIRNIAVTGVYGAGKSSILRTYAKNDKVHKFLWISLASFQYLHRGAIPINEKQIEKAILKQLVYQSAEGKTIDNNIRFIVALIGVLAMGFSFFNPIILYNLFQNWLFMYSWIGYPFVCLFLVGVLFSFYLAERIPMNFKIKQLNFMDTSIKFRNGKKELAFDQYLEDIIAIFQKRKFDVAIFEDLDRLKEKEIFDRLRELNKIINDSNTDRKKCAFVYAINDALFTSTDRVKFFDYILPVLPITNNYTSPDVLIRLFTKFGERKGMVFPEIDRGFLCDVGLYIKDRRMLKNICNEFYIYMKIHQTSLPRGDAIKLDPRQMLALIIYKNLYPYDFAKLQKGQGMIYKALFQRKSHESVTVHLANESFWSGQNSTELRKIIGSDIVKEKMLIYFLKKGYITEDCRDYLTYFYDERMQLPDKNFILSLHNSERMPYEYRISDPEVVIAYLKDDDFSCKGILNFDILHFLLLSTEQGIPIDRSKNRRLLKKFMKTLVHDKNEAFQFIEAYIMLEYRDGGEKLWEWVFDAWPQFWDNLSVQPWSADEKNIYFYSMIRHLTPRFIEAIATEFFKSYFETVPDFEMLVASNSANAERMISKIETIMESLDKIGKKNGWGGLKIKDCARIKNCKLKAFITENRYC